MNILDFPVTQRRFSQEQLDHARKEGAIEMQRRVVEMLETARTEMLSIARTEQNHQCVAAVFVGLMTRIRGIVVSND